MRVLHVTYPSAHVRRSGRRLEVHANRRCVRELQIHGLQQLVLTGNIAVSPAAMSLLLDEGVDTVFLTGSGRYRGRLMGHLSSNIRLRMRQFEFLRDSEQALRFAKQVVQGKIANQRSHLLRHRRRHQLVNLDEAIRALAAARLRSALCTDMDELRGCEGSASAAYFRVFGTLVRVPGFEFPKRSRRPPIDPINAMLSFGYTLLFNLVQSTIERVGLDPYLGALHAPTAGRPSLVCDLVEELRAPVIDALVLGAVNQKSIAPKDFEELGPGEPVRLRRETIRWLVELFERRVEQRVHYPPTKQRLTIFAIIEQQARAAARTFADDVPYEPWLVR